MESLGFDPNAPGVGIGVLNGTAPVQWQMKPDSSTPSTRQVKPGAKLELLDLAPGFLLARSDRIAGWLPRDRVEVAGGLEALARARDQANNVLSRRSAAFDRAKRECPLPVQMERIQLPGGLQLFDDEFLVAVGKDWGWSSQKLTLTTHRVIYSRGRLSKDQDAVYLTDIRDVAFHKPLVGFGTLALETAGGHSIEGLPAASNGAAIRDKLLQLVHYARQVAASSNAAGPMQVAAAPPDKYEQLKKLGDLRAQGIINDEEFASEKQKLLSS